MKSSRWATFKPPKYKQPSWHNLQVQEEGGQYPEHPSFNAPWQLCLFFHVKYPYVGDLVVVFLKEHHIYIIGQKKIGRPCNYLRFFLGEHDTQKKYFGWTHKPNVWFGIQNAKKTYFSLQKCQKVKDTKDQSSDVSTGDHLYPPPKLCSQKILCSPKFLLCSEEKIKLFCPSGKGINIHSDMNGKKWSRSVALGPSSGKEEHLWRLQERFFLSCLNLTLWGYVKIGGNGIPHPEMWKMWSKVHLR